MPENFAALLAWKTVRVLSTHFDDHTDVEDDIEHMAEHAHAVAAEEDNW